MRKLSLFISSLLLIISATKAQKKWMPFAGLNVSGSADFYYVGPSFSAGVIHTIGKKKKWNWAPELTFFYNSSTYIHSSTLSEKDRFESFSIRSNFNFQAGKHKGQGFFFGGGIGFQKASDECWSITDNGTTKEKNVHYDAIRYGIITGTFNTGYNFKLRKRKSLQVLLSAIGPHTAKDYLGTYIEGISVLSLGTRIVW